MAATDPLPFSFADDFRQKKKPAEDTVTVSALKAAREKAHAEGLEAGRIEGRHAALEEETARLARGVEKLGFSLVAALRDTDARLESQARNSTRVAISVAEKIAGRALSHYPASEIEALVKTALKEAASAPHLVLRVNDTLVEQTRALMKDASATSGYAGRIVVIGEPEIAPGDGAVEWADGGMSRTGKDIAERLGALVEAYFDAAHGLENNTTENNAPEMADHEMTGPEGDPA